MRKRLELFLTCLHEAESLRCGSLDGPAERRFRAAARLLKKEVSKGQQMAKDAVAAVPGADDALEVMSRADWNIRASTNQVFLSRLKTVGQLIHGGLTKSGAPKTKKLAGLIKDVIYAGLIFAAIMWFDSQIHQSYRFYASPPAMTAQRNYAEFVQNRSSGLGEVLYQVELGKDSELALPLLANDSFSVELSSFKPSPAWSRPVYWSVQAAGSGEITLRFKQTNPTAVALFMTDGDSFWRMSKVQSAGTTRLADRLYNGRWLVFPVERKTGIKTFSFEQFTGSTIAVSGIAVFGKSE